MLSSFGIYGGLSALLVLAGAALTGYGVTTRNSPNGLSFAIVGLSVLGGAVGLMAIALAMSAPH